jgi:hypothetical protein
MVHSLLAVMEQVGQQVPQEAAQAVLQVAEMEVERHRLEPQEQWVVAAVVVDQELLQEVQHQQVVLAELVLLDKF